MVLPMAFMTAGSYLWWFAMRADHRVSRRAMALTWRYGLLVGGIGFVLGFVGPLILLPDSNQGPLLGFFTGPAGFVLGSLGALIAQAVRSRSRADPGADAS